MSYANESETGWSDSAGGTFKDRWKEAMTDLEAVWRLARSELVVPAEGGGSDIFVWEHSVRVAKSSHYLSLLPEAQKDQPDALALMASALFHEAGWIARWRAGEIERFEMLMGSPTEAILADSVRLMENALRSVIPENSLRTAADAIRHRNGQRAESIESQILCEADHLEEFGQGFLWTAIRRGICGGRGVQAVLDAWRRRIEYHFWTARLKDAFRFEHSRQLAQTRLQQLDVFMREMCLQHGVEDVRRMVEMVRNSPVSPPKWPIESDFRGKPGG